MKRSIAITLLTGLSLVLIGFTYNTLARATVRLPPSSMLQATPALSIDDASLVEGNVGSTNLVFAVTLTASGTRPAVSVRYATANGSPPSGATAPSDYTSASGPLIFPAGTGNATMTISVTVSGDTVVEPDETFFVNLSNADGATITDGQGVGTIISDETCGYEFDAAERDFPIEGGTGTIAITAPVGCEWSAYLETSAKTFITFTSPTADDGSVRGSGNGTVSYLVPSNPDFEARGGFIEIWGGIQMVNDILIHQPGRQRPPCGLSISPANATVRADGGFGSITVTAPHDCAWEATTDAAWIVLDLTAYKGRGNGEVKYRVQDNDLPGSQDPARTGVININGEAQHIVYQYSNDCPIELICGLFPGACTGSISPGLNETRSFRDKVLTARPRGRQYKELYYRFSAEAVSILMLNPMLILRSRQIMDRYMPVIQDMVRGEQVTLSQGDLDEIDGFLNCFAQKGSTELRETIKSLCQDLRDPQVHSEFNLTITEGSARRSPSRIVGKISQRNGLVGLFAFGLGALFRATFRRRTTARQREIRTAFTCVVCVAVLAPYGQPSVTILGRALNRKEPTAIATTRLVSKLRIPAVAGLDMGLPSDPPPLAATTRTHQGLSPQAITDPRLALSTYLGGTGNEEGNSIAVDPAGNIYVTGFTDSRDFPLVHASQPNFGGGQQDAFVTKLDPSGTRVVYSTYIGGAGQDNATAIAIDSSGNAYITGYTDSTDFPVKNALQPLKKGKFNAFITKLDPAGAVLNSTLFGGTTSDYGSAVAVDPAGNIYVAGFGSSRDIPITNALQPESGGLVDAYVAKIDLSGSRLLYSTYLGGTGIEGATSIAVDSMGNAYVTGLTSSPDFRTKNALQPARGGGILDAFVAKLNSSGGLIYSTYLGGSGEDHAFRIAVDSAGAAYLTGETNSPDFPTRNSFQPTFGGGSDAFVAKLNPSGNGLVFSTFLGGSGIDGGSAIAVDPIGRGYVVGFTSSSDFPVKDPIQMAPGGAYDGFVALLSPTGSMLEYSTYLGGSRIDSVFGVAADGTGAYVMGLTASTNFPTSKPVQASFAGGDADLFIAKLTVGPAIADARIEGKKLLVFGCGFDDGAQILVNSNGQKTKNDSTNPATALIAKKAGKKIATGDTVTLQVRNSDGTQSNEFPFRRADH